MTRRLFVYVPMDADFDRTSYTFNAREFRLAPNAVNEIKSPWPATPAAALLTACLEQLGRFGVIECAGDTIVGSEIAASLAGEVVPDSNIGTEVPVWSPKDGTPLDLEATLRGEEIHEAFLRGKHGAVLQAWAGECERYAKLGMTAPPEPANVTKAREKLTEWGLIATEVPNA
jgi:hypothetical protein